MQRKPLPFWIAYARGILLFFVGLMVVDALSYFVGGPSFEWWAILAVASVMPGLGLLITWDEM